MEKKLFIERGKWWQEKKIEACKERKSQRMELTTSVD